ncbi:MAG TPA: hypothetical protein VF160_07090 [Candidatus Dormibacteraeota bacterium]
MNGSKRRTVLGVLLALQGIGAIGGAIFVVPNLSVDNLKSAIFPDYTIPALGLGVLVGGGSLLALLLLLVHSRYEAFTAAGAGLAVMLFEVVEVTAMKGSVFTDPGQLPLWQQPLWFLIGAVIVLLAVGISSTRLQVRYEIARASRKAAVAASPPMTTV